MSTPQCQIAAYVVPQNLSPFPLANVNICTGGFLGRGDNGFGSFSWGRGDSREDLTSVEIAFDDHRRAALHKVR